MLDRIKTFLGNEDGATTTEYAIVAGAIGVAVITAVSALAGALYADAQTAQVGGQG